MGHSIDSENLIVTTLDFFSSKEEIQEKRYVADPFFFLNEPETETD